jgi:two-component system, NarL family, nitrate/nitrite response regulator NarL
MTMRIVVVEDDSRYRRSLELLFGAAPGFSLASSYSSAEGALGDLRRAVADGRRPGWDLLLLDLDLPGLKGIDAARMLKAIWRELPVIVLTVFEEPGTIVRAICAGADGYLLKKISAPELLAQLRAIAAGGAPLTPAVARTVLDVVRAGTPAASGPAGPARLDLSQREQEVLRCLVRGLSYKQAAAALAISLDTVRTHVRGIYGKLQVHSVAEAVSRAIREGLV